MNGYENGHENTFGLSVILESKVDNSPSLIFKFIVLCQKLAESFWFFFIEKYKEGRPTLFE